MATPTPCNLGWTTHHREHGADYLPLVPVYHLCARPDGHDGTHECDCGRSRAGTLPATPSLAS